MKITQVELYQVDVPDRHWAWSDDVFGMPGHRRDQIVILRVCTDAGIDGLGELNLRFPRALVDAGVAPWVGLAPLTINLATAAAAPDTSAARGWDQGFRTYKMKCIVPDQTPELRDRITYIVDRVRAIHERVPDMAVRPDIRRRLREVWAKEDDCLEQSFPVVDGYVAAPTEPGLGITLDMEAVERYGLSG